ncbi:excalibur calcium-binding domain-containing protein [Ensifer sp. ENS07]|uniref:thermonuclease family protein n=1 Tax=Ensifer sp. ENS07 TaxID=2769274 RepID=UPI00178118E0|nr:excalibur calcium-binding domain-containing protein [Ensifer sp. ENS07]MBD9638602.1 excalibur calcium-binding domain-containing protein [Ensifer sp. ENS07]
MRLLFAAVIAAVAATSVSAATVNLIDGDTVRINGRTIRIVEIDAPETYKPRCELERMLGYAAKQRLRQLLDAGNITYEPAGTDRYNRTLAHVFAGGINVGSTLLAEGHALAYRPGADAKLERLRAWCGPGAQLNGSFDKPKTEGARPKGLAAPLMITSAPYRNCSEARAAGAAPLYAGNPGYSTRLDRDGDGVACERRRGR